MRFKAIVQLIFLAVSVSSFAQTIDHWETIVYANTTWKYFPGTSNPGADWKQLNFDDASWSSGTGGIGYGDNDDGTVISPVISVFLRKKFSIVDLTDIEELVLHVDYDDGFVAYINGTEIARENMTGVNPAHNQSSSALHDAVMSVGGRPDSYYLDKETLTSILVQGENILAIQVHNENIGSSDMSSTAFLSAGMNISEMTYGSVPSWFVVEADFESSNLPIIVINTNNGQPIQDEPKSIATIGVINNVEGRNNISDPFEFEGRIATEIRGESSQMFPKKSYSVETQDQAGANLNVALLGMPPENDWVLYAPYTDKTMMRDVLAYKMGRDMGRYAPRTRYVELILNGDYQGVYVLIERIKIDKNRVNIASLNPEETSGDDVTGGYLLRIDKIDGNDYPAWTSVPVPKLPNEGNVNLQFFNPKGEDLVIAQQNYIKKYIVDFESALSSSDFKTARRYKDFMDVPSFIDFMIVNEIGKNIDGYVFSTYLHKDKDSKDKHIHMGPLWDFNLAFGNVDYLANSQFAPGWTYADQYRVYWFRRLMNDPAFKNEFVCRWRTLRTEKLTNEYFNKTIDSIATVLDEAQQRNYQRWPILGVYIWPNQNVGQTYADETYFLKEWIRKRLEWMDLNLPSCEIVTGTVDGERLNIEISPNPSNSKVTLKTSTVIPDAQLLIYNLNGVLVYSHTLREEITTWDGASQSGKSLPPGLYLLKVQRGSKVLAQEKIIRY